MPLTASSTARADVGRAAHLWARCDRARTPLRWVPLTGRLRARGYDLVLASAPQALDGLITPPTHPPRARWLGLDRAGPRPRWTRARRCLRYLWPEPQPRRRPQTPEHPPRPPASEHHKEVLTHAKVRPTRAGSAVRVTSARGPADSAGRGASVHEEGVRNARGGGKRGPPCPIWVDDDPILAKTAGDLKSRCGVVYRPKRVSSQGLASWLSVLWSPCNPL